MTRSQRRAMISNYRFDVLIAITADRCQNIDGSRPSFADLAGLDREDLIGLILKAEYPDTGPRTQVAATTHPPVKSSRPAPDTHTEG